MELFKFQHGNKKLPDSIMHFSLPAGYTCPGARICHSKFSRKTRKIEDGPDCLWRCSAAMEETRPNVNKARDHNHRLVEELKSDPIRLGEHLLLSIKAKRILKTRYVRWFTSGDCYTPALRDAIIYCADMTNLVHYLYTKNLPIWLGVRLPENLRVTASWGGKWDSLIEEGHFPRNAKVFNYYEDAEACGREIDTDDSLAYSAQATAFGLLIHGTQPSGSDAGIAARHNRKLAHVQ